MTLAARGVSTGLATDTWETMDEDTARRRLAGVEGGGRLRLIWECGVTCGDGEDSLGTTSVKRTERVEEG